MKNKLIFMFFLILFLVGISNFSFGASNDNSNVINFTDSKGKAYSVSVPTDVLNKKQNYFICEDTDANIIHLVATNLTEINFNFVSLVYTNDINKNRLYIDFYKFDKTKNSFVFDRYDFKFRGSELSSEYFYFIYSSNLNVYVEYDSLNFLPAGALLNGYCQVSLHYEATSDLDIPFYIYSNWFNLSLGAEGFNTVYFWCDSGMYEEYDPNVENIIDDGVGWDVCEMETSVNSNGNSLMRFKQGVKGYGTYYFLVENTRHESYRYLSITVQEDFHFYLSTKDKTTEPIYLLSSPIYYYDANSQDQSGFYSLYDVEISKGLDSPFEWKPLPDRFWDEDKQQFGRQFKFQISVNGVYTVKIFNFITQKIRYETFIVDNIMTKSNVGEEIYYNNYDKDGNFRPTPVLFLDYLDANSVRIRTQPFTFNEIILLECYVSSDGNNFKKNNNVYSYVDSNNMDLQYFYFDVRVDGRYTFKFYNLDSKKYTEASINVNIKEFIFNNVDKIDKFNDKVVVWAKLHFGILFYPLEFVMNVFDRVSNVNLEDPVLNVPEIRDPFYNKKITSAVNFNFNSVLNNSVANTVYDIYLIAVDFILIVLFVGLCKKVFEEVFK